MSLPQSQGACSGPPSMNTDLILRSRRFRESRRVRSRGHRTAAGIQSLRRADRTSRDARDSRLVLRTLGALRTACAVIAETEPAIYSVQHGGIWTSGCVSSCDRELPRRCVPVDS